MHFDILYVNEDLDASQKQFLDDFLGRFESPIGVSKQKFSEIKARIDPKLYLEYPEVGDMGIKNLGAGGGL